MGQTKKMKKIPTSGLGPNFYHTSARPADSSTKLSTSSSWTCPRERTIPSSMIARSRKTSSYIYIGIEGRQTPRTLSMNFAIPKDLKKDNMTENKVEMVTDESIKIPLSVFAAK